MSERLQQTKWRHLKSGHVYRVICEARVEATLEPVVVYCREKEWIAHGLHATRAWTRPRDEFLDGRFELLERLSI